MNILLITSHGSKIYLAGHLLQGIHSFLGLTTVGTVLLILRKVYVIFFLPFCYTNFTKFFLIAVTG